MSNDVFLYRASYYSSIVITLSIGPSAEITTFLVKVNLMKEIFLTTHQVWEWKWGHQFAWL